MRVRNRQELQDLLFGGEDISNRSWPDLLAAVLEKKQEWQKKLAAPLPPASRRAIQRALQQHDEAEQFTRLETAFDELATARAENKRRGAELAYTKLKALLEKQSDDALQKRFVDAQDALDAQWENFVNTVEARLAGPTPGNTPPAPPVRPPDDSLDDLPTIRPVGRGSRRADDEIEADNPDSIGDLPTIRPVGRGSRRAAAAAARRFRTGDKILGRYRVVGELGQGGMGAVYRCFDEVGGIDVALKALPPELSHNSVEMEEVRENFQLVERLYHPHIAAVKTLERNEASRDYYLILELAEGLDLRRWRKAQPEGRASLEAVVPILRQAAEALDFAHSRKIIHRDIKPANVMVAPDGTVKVLDFGLAAQIQMSLSRVSQAHYATSGTGPYMAPEQWRGQPQDGATDQYALAVLAYELLAGRLPFENTDTAVLKHAVLDETPARLESLSDAAWTALARGLAKDRKARYGNCAALVEALAAGSRSAGFQPARPELDDRSAGFQPAQSESYNRNAGFQPARPELDDRSAGFQPAQSESYNRNAGFQPARRGRETPDASPLQGRLKTGAPTRDPDPIAETQDFKSAIADRKSGVSNLKSKTPLVLAGLLALILLVAGGWYFGVARPAEARRKADLARVEAQARAASDAKEKARLEAEAERLRTEREKLAIAEKTKTEAEQREREQQAAAAKARAEQEQRDRDRLANAKATPEKVPYPTLDAPWENSLGMKFVPVPGTKVLFCVWETRVRDFAAFAGDRERNAGWNYRSGSEPDVLKSDGWKQRGWDYGWNNPGFSQTSEHPVTCVSWDDAQAFCRWLTLKERQAGKIAADQSYRLPADWEWSVAVGLNEARGGTPKEKDGKIKGVYPWGTQWPPPSGAGNYAGSEAKDADWPSNFGTIEGYRDGFARTAPVGSFAANRYGIYDLGGNVWEWCEDYYDGQSGSRGLRGASWGDDDPDYLLASLRLGSTPDSRIIYLGFRCGLGGESAR